MNNVTTPLEVNSENTSVPSVVNAENPSKPINNGFGISGQFNLGSTNFILNGNGLTIQEQDGKILKNFSLKKVLITTLGGYLALDGLTGFQTSKSIFFFGLGQFFQSGMYNKVIEPIYHNLFYGN